MAMTIPSITDVMTGQPITVDVSQSVSEAETQMANLGCRHLPVMKGEELVGVVSDRDMSLALRLTGSSPTEMKVQDVYVEFPYRADIDDPLEKILNDMVELQISSTLVTQNEKLVGIVTTTDICRAFQRCIEESK